MRENEKLLRFVYQNGEIASPAVYKDHKICITDKRLSSEKLKSINDVYDLGPNPCAGDTDVNKELDGVLEVAKYLQVLKNLILVDRSSGRRIAGVQGCVSKLELFMGEKKKGKDKKITYHNKEGLILSLVNKKWEYIRSLMLGDVPYESIPTGIMFAGNTPYDYLIVPHHGAEMDTGLLSSATGKRDGYAIICAKPKRPDAVHKKALEKNGYITMTTGDAGLCIDINLSRKGFPRKRP